MGSLFDKLWKGAVVLSLMAVPVVFAKVTIYMCGDSTMQDWADGYYPKQGQGQDFHYWFDVNLAGVVNRGQGGMSLGGGGKDKSGGTAVGYYDMFFKKGCSNGNCIADKLQSGDYVVIQFGINDVNYSTEDFYKSNMKKMVSDIRGKGANPIIMSPIRRCYYDSPTAIHNSYRGYPALNKQLAEELDVPFIDMSEEVANLMISVGERYAQQFIYNYATKSEYSNLGSDQSDQVHLQMNGANAYGRIITEQMRAHKDPVVKKLGDYMAPMYMVDVKVSPADAAEATSISTYYPKGMTVMLKTIPKNGKKFLGWYDGNGNKVGANSRSNVKSSYIHTFVMGDKATQYTAVYEGGTAEKYAGDGAALKAFPTTTPKSLDDVTFVPFTPMDGSEESNIPVDKDIKKFFDAYKPDVGAGTSDSDNQGFHGEGFFNFTNEKNSSATYKVKFPGAGHTTLAIIYANGGTSDRMINAYLDHDYYVSAPPTGSWTTWDTAYVVLDAPQGEAELKLMSLTSDGGPNIDMIGFSMDGVCRVSEGCTVEEPKIDTTKKDTTVTPKDSVKDSTVKNPNPDDSTTIRIMNNVNLVNDGMVNVSIYNLKGELVAKRLVPSRTSLSNQMLKSWVKSSGVYRVVKRQGNVVSNTSMFIQ